MYRIRNSYTRISSSTPIGSNICQFVPRGRWPRKYPKILRSTQDSPYRGFKLDKMFPEFSLRSDRLHSVWEINAMKFPPRAMHEFLNGRLGHFMHPWEFLVTLSSFKALCCFCVQLRIVFFLVAQYGNWVLVPLNPGNGNWAIANFPIWILVLRSHLSPENPSLMHEPEFRL